MYNYLFYSPDSPACNQFVNSIPSDIKNDVWRLSKIIFININDARVQNLIGTKVKYVPTLVLNQKVNIKNENYKKVYDNVEDIIKFFNPYIEEAHSIFQQKKLIQQKLLEENIAKNKEKEVDLEVTKLKSSFTTGVEHKIIDDENNVPEDFAVPEEHKQKLEMLKGTSSKTEKINPFPQGGGVSTISSNVEKEPDNVGMISVSPKEDFSR